MSSGVAGVVGEGRDVSGLQEAWMVRACRGMTGFQKHEWGVRHVTGMVRIT